MKRKIVYFDMDNTLVNFQSGIDSVVDFHLKTYEGHLDDVPNIFSLMKPNDDVVALYNKMADDERFDCYVLSTAPWDNPSAWMDKVEWIQKYLPKAHKRLILSHNKQLNCGDYLIDDRTANGAGDFEGEHIHIHTEKYPDVESIEKYLNI